MSLLAKWKESRKREKFKEMQEDVRLQEIVQERRKSNAERVLEKFQEEERQEQIKEAVKELNKKKDAEGRRTFMFDDKNSMLKEDFKIMKHDNKLFDLKGNQSWKGDFFK